MNFFDSNNNVMVGWNQDLQLNGVTIKVTSFNIGVTQSAELPDLVTGLSDKLAFQKGTISVAGNISAPMTKSVADSIVSYADDIRPITLTSSAVPNGITYEIYINQLTITMTAGEPIQVSADFIGKIIGAPNENDFSSASGMVTTKNIGKIGGATNSNYFTEQIPMFDRVYVDSGFLPTGNTDNQIPISLTFTCNNNLQANYVLAVDTFGSLNPFSISRGQRLLSGSMGFQSGYSPNSQLSVIMNAGASDGVGGFKIYEPGNYNTVNIGSTLLDIKGSNFVPIWNAAPPTIGTDRITYDVEYKLLAKSAGIHKFTN